MKPKYLLLVALLAVMVGLSTAAAPPQLEQQAVQTGERETVNPRKLCGLPPPPGVSLEEWEETCFSCTSIPVSKEASADGSVMTSHSCDGHYEIRVKVVPGKKNAPGTMRPIMKGGGLGADRPPERKVGEMPEVEETFTRYDAAYSFMNEKQLIIGETTIGGRRELYNDEGLMDIMELQRLALERASTAREAIKIMGDAATKYGYGDSGECLTIGDGNEVWFFEIFGAGPIEKGAVWAAKRIPPGEIGVSANRPRITTLNLNDPNDSMASDNVYEVAEQMGWWKKGEPFVFNKVYGGTPSYGSTRREWRVLSTLAPSLKLDPWSQDVPFSVKPDRKVTPQDLMALHRDVYEGTEFDMTKDEVAGPFANPNRWGASYRPPDGFMGFERMIAVTQCSYVVVLQARSWLPAWIGGLAWYAPDDAKTSTFVPFYAGNTTVPEAFQIGNRAEFDRRSAWWAFNFAGNWANLNYRAMSAEIRKAASEMEARLFAQQPTIEKMAVELYKQDPEAARAFITGYSNREAQNAVDAWWRLADRLVVRYHDLGQNLPGQERTTTAYPEEYLKKSGYGTKAIPKKTEPAPKPAGVK